MNAIDQAAWVFAGDSPGSWWLVHTRAPRFAARLLSTEEFAAHPRLSAWVPHGLSSPTPIHFTLGADVLVITDFLDPVVLEEGVSPQKAILTDAMIEALDACQKAIAQVAVSAEFAPLAEHAEQFLVGWRRRAAANDAWEWLHPSGARVETRIDADGDCEAELQHPPGEAQLAGWDPLLLRERLERVAGERAMCVNGGWEALHSLGGSELHHDVFQVIAEQQRRHLHWVAIRQTLDDGNEIGCVALQVKGPLPLTCPTPVEIDATSPLLLGDRPLSDADVEAILELQHAYGLSSAVGLVASHHFGWLEENADSKVRRQRAAPLPRYPCEVEVVNQGVLSAAVILAPPDTRGRFRVVIAPHAQAASRPGDSGAVLPFEGMLLRREQFHLPAYLQ
ncbi:hypothetical protein [Pseudomarimonas arenosa]|uniref:Uncharacterized protein n=1 Tax=Pseudomarimonas arenosa TaxID=2774145 RepID=A0AAW3ZTK5_9GAMM|nr:hypothetical protein [Pseudomarimonas arenosa]MBD8527849.1 hypothetical protein [Pseudomarimonas arenosa]